MAVYLNIRRYWSELQSSLMVLFPRTTKKSLLHQDKPQINDIWVSKVSLFSHQVFFYWFSTVNFVDLSYQFFITIHWRKSFSQKAFLTLYIFKVHSETILLEQEHQKEFIICGYNLNERLADDGVLPSSADIKLQEIL